ncbi:MAG TPA: NAD(P)H-dependent oxidoreductase subunit E [Fimbriimonadaceae bacterium]|nr:NAD(P)H-dependent oxidoreductase subunit E [Fimbriimonadaceae bacterium]HRJ33956.1 NAD(P)H-dependent oxidoreductase subunit E [Fimbriimonadaceae bacterium]
MSELLQIGAVNERPKPPRAEDLNLRFSDRAVAELEALKTHYPNWKACILPGLWIAQREYGGFLSGEAIAEVAHRLQRSYAEVEGVATFYSMYNTAHVPGKHKIEVCTCLTCQVCGAYPLWEHLKAKLGIGHGETTADGMFTLEEVECLNACDRAPLIQVGDQYIGPLDTAGVDRLLDELRGRSDSTVVQMADVVVQVHLREPERNPT